MFIGIIYNKGCIPVLTKLCGSAEEAKAEVVKTAVPDDAYLPEDDSDHEKLVALRLAETSRRSLLEDFVKESDGWAVYYEDESAWLFVVGVPEDE